MYYTYVLHHPIKDKIYIGHTSNLKSRLDRHNGKLPSKKTSYTSKIGSGWILVYYEIKDTRNKAVIREKQLKTYKGREFIKTKLNGPVAQR